MNIIEILEQKVRINFSLQDLIALSKILDAVKNVLLTGEFNTRVGSSSDEIQSFLNSSIETIQRSGRDSYDFLISLDEITMINCILNEICHGIYLPDIEEKIGTSKEKTKEMLSLINPVMNQMYYHYNPGDVIIPRKPLRDIFSYFKSCRFEAENFQVEFYIRKLQRFKSDVQPDPISKDNLGIFIVLNFKSDDHLNFELGSAPRNIQSKELFQLMAELECYVNNESSDEFKKSTKRYATEIFQISILDKISSPDNIQYLVVNFMLRLSQKWNTVACPYIGIQSAVSFANVRNFTQSMRNVLKELLN
jgi:hypothetical protein